MHLLTLSEKHEINVFLSVFAFSLRKIYLSFLFIFILSFIWLQYCLYLYIVIIIIMYK